MRYMSMMLVLCMLISGLSGCTGEDSASLYEELTGIPSDAALLTVNGRTVPAGQYCCWLANTCETLVEAVGQQSLDWESEVSGETTLAAYAKQQALSTAVYCAVIEEWAERYGCALTVGDRMDLTETWQSASADCGGETAYLEMLGTDQASAEALSADYYLYRQLYELFRTEGSALYPGDEAMAEAEQQSITVETIFVSTADADGDQALAERRERAEMVLTKLNSSAAPLEYFSTLAGTYSDRDDGVQTVSIGDGTLPSACETAAAQLSEDQWSGVVEAADGYYLLLRKPLDRDAVHAAHFSQMLEDAVSDAEVQVADTYDTIDVAAFCEGLF